MKLSVFIPVYTTGEITGLKENLTAFMEVLKAWEAELFIVDDNSPEVPFIRDLRAFAEEKGIEYVKYENGPSRRENLGKAFGLARNEVVFFVDADFPVDPAYFPKLMKEMEKGCHVAVGSRYAEGAVIKRRPFRKFISLIYNGILRLLFGSRVKDHQCGFKAFRREVVMELLGDMGYDERFARGWLWDAELLIRAQRKGYRVEEIPVRWIFGEQSTFQFSREARLLSAILSLRLRL